MTALLRTCHMTRFVLLVGLGRWPGPRVCRTNPQKGPTNQVKKMVRGFAPQNFPLIYPRGGASLSSWGDVWCLQSATAQVGVAWHPMAKSCNAVIGPLRHVRPRLP